MLRTVLENVPESSLTLEGLLNFIIQASLALWLLNHIYYVSSVYFYSVRGK